MMLTDRHLLIWRALIFNLSDHIQVEKTRGLQLLMATGPKLPRPIPILRQQRDRVGEVKKKGKYYLC